MWKEIGKGILRNAATAYGTRVLVERVVPAAEEMATATEEEAPKFKTATTRVVSKPSKIIDAEVE